MVVWTVFLRGEHAWCNVGHRCVAEFARLPHASHVLKWGRGVGCSAVATSLCARASDKQYAALKVQSETLQPTTLHVIHSKTLQPNHFT